MLSLGQLLLGLESHPCLYHTGQLSVLVSNSLVMKGYDLVLVQGQHMGIPGLSVRTSSKALSEEGEHALSSLLHHALCSVASVINSYTCGS